MRDAYDAAQIRAAEAPLLDALPPGTLMARAARALARRCAALLGRVYGSHVVLLVGSGNNGADALWAGEELARRGARVDALLVGSADVRATDAFCAAGGRNRQAGGDDDAALLDVADLVVDGLVGIGAGGALRDPHAKLAALAAEHASLVVAVDVPSGVDASTGAVSGTAVRADVTVTFGGWKTGLLVAPGSSYAGTVEVVDIGLSLPPASVTAPDAADIATLLPRPEQEWDKYRRGVLGVVAGSDRYPGAAVLSVGGALAIGVGMVRFVGQPHPGELVRSRWPEAVARATDDVDVDELEAAGRVQAWVCGPGIGTGDDAAATVSAVCARPEPLLLDADALTIVARDPDLVRHRAAATVLTPHAGELARLLDVDRDAVEAERLQHGRAAVERFEATVLLKGSGTVVASSDGMVRVTTAQTPYLATAGSGDVLSGVCGALLAAGLAGPDAATVGAFVHGFAGIVAAGDPPAAITAVDIIAAVPHAVRALSR